jgi:ATP-dependent Clp protease protease subunit
LWLESDNPEKPITMYINSPGGDVSAGLAIYDTMTYVKPAVSTVCVGMAASMAAILLLGGQATKRYALPHSSVMMHQPHGGTRGQASDILIYATQIIKLRQQINDIVIQHLNQAGRQTYTMADVENLMERDKYLTAQDALEMGVIDEILQSRAKQDTDSKAKEADKPS